MGQELYSFTVSRDSATVTRASFSNPLVLGASNRFPERYRVYELTGTSPLAGLEADGFVATDAEHLMVSRLVSSTAKPSKVVVGNARNRPTLRYRVTVYEVKNATKYAVRAAGQACEFTSSGTATAAEIATGLKADIDAKAIAGLTTTTGADYVEVVAGAVGTHFSMEVDRALLSLEMNHVDPGVAEDLSALALDVQKANGAADFYTVLLAFPSTATVLAAAAWVEINSRFLLFSSSDTRMVRGVVSNNKDVATQLLEAGYMRTACLFHHDPGQFAAVGWAGRCLPLPAGTETWLAKTIGGLTITDLTGTERAQLQARRVSYYISKHGIPQVLGDPGAQTFSGEYIDNLRGTDEMLARMGEDYTAMVANRDPKIPYDDAGFQKIGGTVESTLRKYESQRNTPRLFRQGSIVVEVPRLSEVSEADRAARYVPITWTAFYAQAAHKAGATGTVR